MKEKICQVCGKKITSELDWFSRNGAIMCRSCTEKYDSNEKGNNQQIQSSFFTSNYDSRENTVAKIIKIIGIVEIISGIISGLIIWGVIAEKFGGDLGFIACIVEMIMSFIYGMLFVGLSEIIYLLQHNVNITRAMWKNISPNKTVNTDIMPNEDAIKQKTNEPEIDVKTKIKDETLNENQIKCPHCGHIQSKSIARCLGCSKMITESVETTF